MSPFSGIQRPNIPGLLDDHCISVEHRGNLFYQVGCFLDDIDLNTWFPIALTLSSAHNARVRHQPIGVLSQYCVDRLFWHRAPTQLGCLQRTATSRSK
jgi:hypothetical protein